jgi:hypothetical protein
MRLWMIAALISGAPAFGSPLEDAKAAYEAGRPEAAIAEIEKMPEAPVSGALQGALGAAWFKKGDVGRAIFHFRRASELRPRDADLRYNLGFARKSAKDRLEAPGGFFTPPFSVKETATGAAWLSLLAGILGGLWAFSRRQSAKLAAVIAASLAVLVSGVALLALTFDRPFGVVTAAEAAVRSGPGESYTHLFSLHPGAEFDRLREEKGWLQIRLSDGKRGWVDATATVF